jgi:hypothetical protein
MLRPSTREIRPPSVERNRVSGYALAHGWTVFPRRYKRLLRGPFLHPLAVYTSRGAADVTVSVSWVFDYAPCTSRMFITCVD